MSLTRMTIAILMCSPVPICPHFGIVPKWINGYKTRNGIGGMCGM
ncbi:MAG TPA: hypothetical protein VMX97_05820 [Hyphomicrobiaceae bacterium]|nr:hypothetical protein [Hyphomicrobiaceae bacterium]